MAVWTMGWMTTNTNEKIDQVLFTGDSFQGTSMTSSTSMFKFVTHVVQLPFMPKTKTNRLKLRARKMNSGKAIAEVADGAE